MAAKTRSGQAGVGEALGETVGDDTGDRVGPAEVEPQAEMTATAERRMATSAPQCLSDDFFMAWPST